MKRFLLEPEVAGHIGENSILDTLSVPPVVQVLHYEFDGWLGDDILESFPCFICTEKLASKLKGSLLSGYSLDVCEVSKSITFIELYPSRELPLFYWLKIVGGKNDDFSLSGTGMLEVSSEALTMLRQVNIDYCDITEL